MNSDTPLWRDVSLLVAYIGLIGSLLTIAVNGYVARKQQRRELFAEALAVVVAYSEFPYVVRRRRHDEPAAERVRISEQLREVQQEIAFYQAWIRTESREVARVYDELVVTTRTVMGSQIRKAWQTPPITTDEGMNISDIQRDGLDRLQDDYLAAVKKHLSFRCWLSGFARS